ncbi:hypothetical protein V6N13_142680 [Hibiscus sabdariffa]|uniref:Uncharacterized protein n=1 Tax=Hibiscus sabdariffa TaxID=183260 RepID=A0ABR2FF39_9ROSI
MVGDSSTTQPKQPLSNLSNALDHVHNSRMGISEKELDALAEITDELGVDSSMFVGSYAAATIAITKGKAPLQSLLILWIDPGSSSKDAGSISLKQA